MKIFLSTLVLPSLGELSSSPDVSKHNLSLLLRGLSWCGLQGLDGVQGWDGRAEGAVFGEGKSLGAATPAPTTQETLGVVLMPLPFPPGRERSHPVLSLQLS